LFRIRIRFGIGFGFGFGFGVGFGFGFWFWFWFWNWFWSLSVLVLVSVSVFGFGFGFGFGFVLFPVLVSTPVQFFFSILKFAHTAAGMVRLPWTPINTKWLPRSPFSIKMDRELFDKNRVLEMEKYLVQLRKTVLKLERKKSYELQHYFLLTYLLTYVEFQVIIEMTIIL
jgi:hypothetical protein